MKFYAWTSMKCILLMTSLITSIAHAGTAEQDPVVAQLRNEFMSANVVVSQADLLFGATWNCTDVYAAKDQYGSRTFYQKFQEVNGIIENYDVNPIEFLAQTSAGLSGVYVSNYTYNDVFRVTSTGALIEELSLSLADPDNVNSGWTGDPSIANPALITLNYIACSAK